MNLSNRCRWIVWLAVWSATVACASASPPNEGAKETAKLNVTIGKETTFITEPLRPDGYPDYVAALNQRTSEGVTRENNAAVLIVKAIGPNMSSASPVWRPIKPEHCKLLGIEPLPEQGDYFVMPGEIIRQWRESHKAPPSEKEDPFGFSEASDRPWKASEFPLVAEWIKKNEKPLSLVTSAAAREKWFFPVVAADDEASLITASARQELWPIEDLVGCLCTRAFMKCAQGNIEGAWQDAMCCHRLARLIDQGVLLADTSLARKIERRTELGIDPGILHFGKPSAKLTRKMEAEYAALAPLKSFVDKLDFSERLIPLNAICFLARGQQPKGRRQSFVPPSVFDYDVALAMVNESYDKLLATARIEDRAELRAALNSHEEEIKKLTTVQTSKVYLILDIAKNGLPKALGFQLGAQILGLCYPSIGGLFVLERESKLESEFARTALLLAVYRADMGQYPKTLDQLVPKYMAKVPVDTFAKQPAPIRYRREKDAYLLWTAGPWGQGDASGPNESSDIVVRPVWVKDANSK